MGTDFGLGSVLKNQLAYLLITTLNETLTTRQVCTCPVQYLLSWQHVLRPCGNALNWSDELDWGNMMTASNTHEHLSCWTWSFIAVSILLSLKQQDFYMLFTGMFPQAARMKSHMHCRSNTRLNKIHIQVPSLTLLVSLVTEMWLLSVCVSYNQQFEH